MKTLKQILEASNHLPNMPVGSSDVEDGPHAHHGRGKAEGEINWKKKHTDNVLELDHPTGKENMDTLNARNMKKDKSKIAGLDKDAEKGNKEINIERTEDAIEVSPDYIATGCPFCNTMMNDGVKHYEKEESIQVLDIAELIANAAEL